jgi:predicted nucleic acid-binding protein
VSILIDSCIWIDWLQKRIDPRPHIRPWLLQQRCFTCGIVRLEVLRGIVSKAQRDKVEELFELQEEVPTDGSLWREVSQMAWELDRRGAVLPVSDLVIAICAKRVGAWVVTSDAHFRKIRDLKSRADLPSRLE